MHDVGRLVPLLFAAEDLRYEVGAVGLDQQPVVGDSLGRGPQHSNFLFV